MTRAFLAGVPPPILWLAIRITLVEIADARRLAVHSTVRSKNLRGDRIGQNCSCVSRTGTGYTGGIRGWSSWVDRTEEQRNLGQTQPTNATCLVPSLLPLGR